jgi:hypothetical protein
VGGGGGASLDLLCSFSWGMTVFLRHLFLPSFDSMATAVIE